MAIVYGRLSLQFYSQSRWRLVLPFSSLLLPFPSLEPTTDKHSIVQKATAEGFFCWRLCAVSNKLWMKTIGVLLWTFSTASHIIWVSMLGAAWQLTEPTVPDPPRVSSLLYLLSFSSISRSSRHVANRRRSSCRFVSSS
jgi:hypothetical protein